MKKINSGEIISAAIFAALIIIGTFIKIPTSVVPVTLQTFFVLLTGYMLNKRASVFAVLIYILLGLAGLPVFAAGGGVAYIFKPTFGYVLGFLVCVFVMNSINQMTFKFSDVLSGILGMTAIYIVGIFYFILVSRMILNISYGIGDIILICLLPVLPIDILSVICAKLLSDRIKKAVSSR